MNAWVCFPHSLYAKFLLLLLDDRTHFRYVFGDESEGGVDVPCGKEIDRILFPAKAKFVKVEEWDDLQGLHLRPAEPGVLISFDYDNFIFANRNPLYLIIHEQENEKEHQAQSYEDQGNKKILVGEAELNKKYCSNEPLNASKHQEEEFRQIEFYRTCFNHFN